MLTERMAIKDTFRRAFIEFVIIVTGITAAFVVDEWREKRQEQQALDQYLTDIASEIKGNLWTLKRIRDGHLQKKIESLQKVISFVQQPELGQVDAEELISILALSSEQPRPWFVKYNHNALINSGNLRLIRDQELMRLLSSTYEGDDVLLSRVENVRGSYQAYVNQLIPARYQSEINFLGMYVNKEVKAPEIADNASSSQFLEQIEKSRPELLRLARNEAAVATGLWYAYTRLEAQFEAVQDELEKRGYVGVDVFGTR